jgi:ABC-2 type transport system ATP-binding protein
VTGFLGPNGAGKSTTMRLMLGLDHGEGTTTFDGRLFTELDHPMRHVGALLEAKPFHPTRKARNHLRMLAAANGIPDGRVDEVLGQLGLTEVARSKPKTFSLGMGQRLGLAAALLGDPHTLILDEPANGQGRSVFVSSHLLSEMALLADDLVVIGRGRLISSGPVADFVKGARGSVVVVRSPDAARLAELLQGRDGVTVEAVDGGLQVGGVETAEIGDLAFDNGIRLHELTARLATLEEAFLEATAGSEEYLAHEPGQAPPPRPLERPQGGAW